MSTKDAIIETFWFIIELMADFIRFISKKTWEIVKEGVSSFAFFFLCTLPFAIAYFAYIYMKA